MINSSSSPNTYDKTISNLLPQRTSQSISHNFERFLNRTYTATPEVQKAERRRRFQSQNMMARVSSKTVDLRLVETDCLGRAGSKPKECSFATSTELLYSSKKRHYVNLLKERSLKAETAGSLSILKVKLLSVFNFSSNFFYQDLNLIVKKNKFKCPVQSKGLRIKSQQSKSCSDVLALESSGVTRKGSEPIDQCVDAVEYLAFEIVPVPGHVKVSPIPKKKAFLKRIYAKKSNQAPSTDHFYPFRKKDQKRKHFSFGAYERSSGIDLINKDHLLNYHDFLWKLNYSNGLFAMASERDAIFRAYVGQGNNSNLIKSIIRRRFWWSLAQNQDSCDFAWSQLRVTSIFPQQNRAITGAARVHSCLEPPGQQGGDGESHHRKIFNRLDMQQWSAHFEANGKTEKFLTEKTYENRCGLTAGKSMSRLQDCERRVLHNHFQHNGYIGNKKALFYLMKNYYHSKGEDVFQVLPLTFHVNGLEDPQWKTFQQTFQDFEARRTKGEKKGNIWIVKPGENSNRGNGITVCYQLEDIRLRLKSRETNRDGSLRTFIIQKYMEDPLLYSGRKFDLRHYLLLTCYNGAFKAYWFEEGYARTSSSPFSLKRSNSPFVHLTNDAVQKNGQDYGRFEQGNKVSYDKLNRYINKNSKNKGRNSFFEDVLPRMKRIAAEAVRATYSHLDPKRRLFNFQLLGMDFMIDVDLRPWLIEVNTNPCLETNSPLLAHLVPQVLEHTFRLTVDPLFPPPEEWPAGRKLWLPENPLQVNRFSLIFDEREEGKDDFGGSSDEGQLPESIGKVEEECQLFESEGRECREAVE